MALTLSGSCHCGAIRFTCDSHAPQPYQRCYCSICRKTTGGGGYAINLSADATTMRIEDPDGTRRIYRAKLVHDDSESSTSPGERSFCSRCGSPLWLWDPRWPELIHPIASAIDTPLPAPPESTHILLDSKASWVRPQAEPGDGCFDAYPAQSIEDWHRARGLWVE